MAVRWAVRKTVYCRLFSQTDSCALRRARGPRVLNLNIPHILLLDAGDSL